MKRSLFHLFVIALLAYRMGGAISAANTAYTHQWKLSGEPKMRESEFHEEGDKENILDDHRVTLVWEERGKGTYHIFREKNATPRLLTPLSVVGQGDTTSPMLIIYNSRNTSLWYDCQNVGAVRNSIGLDFHVNTLTNSDLYGLIKSSQSGCSLNELNLTQLITKFPIPNYTDHFNRLLFETSSRDAILSTLEPLNVLEPVPSPRSLSAEEELKIRYQEWKEQNLNHVPDSVRGLENDILISGTCTSLGDFVSRLSHKKRQDIHLFIGMDLVPQNVVDDQREFARKSIREQTVVCINKRLVQYIQALASAPYVGGSLLPTAQLQIFSTRIEIICLDLFARGYTDSSFFLFSVSCLSSALGKALDGSKEVNVAPKLVVTRKDLQVFRTRCLYLFWCADYLLRYLMNPQEGKLMISRMTREKFFHIWTETVNTVELLLRNWVAWGLFVETRPTGGSTVRNAAQA